MRTAVEYLEQVPDLIFDTISSGTFSVIQEEGLDEEKNAFSKNSWLESNLFVDEDDVKGLINLDNETVNKFNEFDILLKDKYKLNLIDLIDYETGKILIVKTRD